MTEASKLLIQFPWIYNETSHELSFFSSELHMLGSIIGGEVDKEA